jgi:hypothetical protein
MVMLTLSLEDDDTGDAWISIIEYSIPTSARMQSSKQPINRYLNVIWNNDLRLLVWDACAVSLNYLWLEF